MMNEEMSELPQVIANDPDGVQVALRAAHALWSRGDTAESLKWLRKAAESASDEGADARSLQLAKAAAELRARLGGASEPPRGSGNGLGSVPPPAQGSGAFPPSNAGPGESGSHPIAQPYVRHDAEPPHASLSSAPPIEAFTTGASSAGGPPAGGLPAGALSEDGSVSSSRPVTATQYPSHRPRPRVGHLSSAPAASRDSAAYATVPSWSADSERRPSAAPPPLPRTSVDDYEELEAEPDEEPADDPGSVWASGAPESWRPSDLRASAAGATPPPLPPADGAFSDDESEFTQRSEAQTVALPSIDRDGAGASGGVSSGSDAAVFSGSDAAVFSGSDAAVFSGSDAAGFSNSAAAASPRGAAWEQPPSRSPSWERDPGSSSWAAELHSSSWGQPAGLGEGQGPRDGSSNGSSPEPASAEPASQSEVARAKLTARVHHQAVRVSFAPDLRVPGQYVVRPLREGEKAAAGERVALLVALEPGTPLV